MSILQTLPKEILYEIFLFLSPEDLTVVSRVCKQWKALSYESSLWNRFDPTRFFPKLTVINEKVWKNYIALSDYDLSFADMPSHDIRQLIPFIKKTLKTLKVENDAGITLLTLPKGLSYTKLKLCSQKPLKGNPVKFKDTYFPICFETEEITKTHTVVISNSILENSRKLSAAKQDALLSETQCEKPKALHIATLAALTHVISQQNPPVRLFSDKPMTYSSCSDSINDCIFVAGGYSELGFGIDIFNYHFTNQFCGMAVMRSYGN